MHSPGLCVVIIVSLCGLFRGAYGGIGDGCKKRADCGEAGDCLGGKCLCTYGKKANSEATACEDITDYKGCNDDVDCGGGTCTSNACGCNSQFVAGERCEFNTDPFVIIPLSSRGVMAARFSISTVALLSVAGLVLGL